MINIIGLVIVFTVVLLLTMQKPVDNQSFTGMARLNTTAYRGGAMLIIMLSHITGEWGFKPFTPFGGIGVAIFLFLSGFGLSESLKKNGLDGFWQKKLVRVVVPYALFRIVCMMADGSCNWQNLLLDICCWCSSYWYIDYMVRCYIVFWVANRFFGKYKWFVFSAFALYTFFFMTAIRAEQSLSFFVGVLCSDYAKQINAWNKKTYAVVMVQVSAIGIACLAIKQLPAIRELIDTYYYYLVELGIKLPLGIALMCSIYLLPVRIRKSQLLIFCSTYSLELYLVHMQFVSKLADDNFTQALAALIISGLIAYSFSKAVASLLSMRLDFIKKVKV